MTDDIQWIKRVLMKLNERYLQGSDFEDRRWIFDWNDDISLNDNLNNVHIEDNAIQTLTHAGVIKSRLLPNRFRSDQLDKFEDPRFAHLPKHERILYGEWYDVDPAYREWEWIRTLDGFDYHKFIEQSRIFGYNPSITTDTIATLRLINGLVPVVAYENKVLEFKKLTEDSITQQVLEYASWHYGEKITLKKLGEELSPVQLRGPNANLKQSFKSSPFLSGGLSVFAIITPQSITLRDKVMLDSAQLKELESSSI